MVRLGKGSRKTGVAGALWTGLLLSVTVLSVHGVGQGDRLSAKSVPSNSCPIVPVPGTFDDLGGTAELLGPGSTIIVLGNNAVEPERYAAERLQTLVRRRFRQTLPICELSGIPASAEQLLLLGQTATNARVKALCAKRGIDMAGIAGKV